MGNLVACCSTSEGLEASTIKGRLVNQNDWYEPEKVAELETEKNEIAQASYEEAEEEEDRKTESAKDGFTEKERCS